MSEFTERTQQRADHTKVRDDSQPAAWVRADQFIHIRMGTLRQLSQVFTGTGPNIEIPGVEAPQGVTARTFDLIARQTFPFADVEFAQPRIQLGTKVVRFPDDRGGLDRATEIARNDYVNRFVGEISSKRARLRSAAIGERRIPVPLPATLRVPGRLGVSDQQQRRLPQASISVRDQRRLSPASGSANKSAAMIGVKQCPRSTWKPPATLQIA
jgi:hypothetical protein